MHCVKCGTKRVEGAKYCGECGFDFTRTEPDGGINGQPAYTLISIIVACSLLANLSITYYLTESYEYPANAIALTHVLWALETGVFGFILGKQQKGVLRGIGFVLLFMIIVTIADGVVGMLFSMVASQSVFGTILGECIAAAITLIFLLAKLYRKSDVGLHDNDHSATA